MLDGNLQLLGYVGEYHEKSFDAASHCISNARTNSCEAKIFHLKLIQMLIQQCPYTSLTHPRWFCSLPLFLELLWEIISTFDRFDS